MTADQAPARRHRRSRGDLRVSAQPWILRYHSVSDEPYPTAVPPGRLDRQLAWLRGRKLRGVGVRELLHACAEGRADGLVGLTFDDGYADFLENALPLLRNHGCNATLFVLSGRIGKDNAWNPAGPRKALLTSEGIRAAARAGVEIGSHGLYHENLLVGDDGVRYREVVYSRQALRDITGRAPEGFCYPYGAVDERLVDLVRAAGYAYACAIGPSPLTGPYALARVQVGRNDGGLRMSFRHRLQPLRRPRLTEKCHIGSVAAGAGS